jgi:allophanate hydrolase
VLLSDPDAIHSVTRKIIEAGSDFSALDAFRAQYRLRELAARAAGLWQSVDTLLLPTAATHYTIEEVSAQPLQLNSNLGRYTNFVNLLDLAAVAVPAGFTQQGLPFGVTLLAPAWQDEDLLQLAGRMHAGVADTAVEGNGSWQPAATIDVAVCGAHMSGLALNHQLTDRGAWQVATTRTAPEYRLYALPGGPPARPGLVRVASGGAAIDIEIWRMPEENFGSFMACVRSPLGIGLVQTASGSQVCGFLCEAVAISGALEISHHGGWRSYLSQQRLAAQ